MVLMAREEFLKWWTPVDSSGQPLTANNVFLSTPKERSGHSGHFKNSIRSVCLQGFQS